MGQICRNRIQIQLDAFALVLLAAGLLILPLPWIGAAFLAGAVHELSHWAAVCLCGGRICRLRVGVRGAVMDAPPMTEGKKLLCALAGPIGGLCLLLIGRHMPRTALCAAIQSTYNLLPVCPLDGGRALESLASRLFPQRIAHSICRFAAAATCVFILLLGAYTTFVWRVGILGLLIAITAVARIRGNSRKTPCKVGQFTIQ